MQANRDIKDIHDIRAMVDSFYGKIRNDGLLGELFDSRIGDRWPEHLEKMYRFWQTILLEEHTYEGRPFPPHAKMPLDKQHFDRWVSIFDENINELFEGEKAEEAKWRAHRMAALFRSKIEYLQSNPYSVF